MTFNTGNPIGSADARDLSDNAENFDKALGTLDATWTDRLGVTRDSFEGRLAKGSFYRVGDFTAGYTLTNMRQTLEYNGHEYSWAGTFPKVVAAGSTPATSGGVGAGAWIDRSDVVLRDQLAESTGATKVGTSDGGSVQDFIDAQTFANVAAMLAYTGLTVGQKCSTGGTTWKYLGVGSGLDAFDNITSIDVRDFFTGLVSERDAIQGAFDNIKPYAEIIINDHIFNEAVIVTKPVTIKANPISTIEQTVWGKPVYIIQKYVPDVKFIGKHIQINSQPRVYPIPIPTSTDPRIQQVYTEAAGSERILCAGIVQRSPSHNFYIEDQYSKGFFCGISSTGKTTTTDDDSKNVYIGRTHNEDTDWGVLIGGGMRDITIDQLVADNVSIISPSDPSHAIYVGPRSAGILTERVRINELVVNSTQGFIAGQNTADAFSIRSCKDASIGKVSIRNAKLIGNARAECNVVIEQLHADLAAFNTETDIYSAISSQTDSSINIMYADITSRNSSTGVADNCLLQASSGGSICINSGTLKNKATSNAGTVCRFGGKNLKISKDVEIQYDSAISPTITDAIQYPIYSYLVPTGFVLIDEPKLSGLSKLFLISASGTSANNWLVNIDPQKITSGMTSDTVFANSGVYRVGFKGFARDPALIPAAATSQPLHGCNTYKTQNIAAVSLSSFQRGVPQQEYLIIAGDTVTSITHGNFANGFVTKDGLNIGAGTWKAIKAIWITDRLYEMDRF